MASGGWKLTAPVTVAVGSGLNETDRGDSRETATEIASRPTPEKQAFSIDQGNITDIVAMEDTPAACPVAFCNQSEQQFRPVALD
jgi:hypothetical protein